VRRADHPALGLCLDSFHVLSRGDDPSGIRVVPGSKIFVVQLADAPRLNMDVIEWSRHHRLFPGLGSFDLTDFMGHVLSPGYDSPISLEVFNDVYRQTSPRHAAFDGMRSLLALQESVRSGEPASGLVAAPELARRIVMTSPCSVWMARSGPAFRTCALDSPIQVSTGPSRCSCGSRGSARILLNFAAQQSFAPGTAAICALGLESADPAQSADRAQQLLAPVLPRVRQPEEAELASVAAPDGTAVFFCRTGSDGSGWLGDFAATGTPPPADGLSAGIDRVSLTESLDEFDEAAQFYHLVLGLEATEPIELAAPFGLIRSRSAVDRTQRVRITLNTTSLRRGDWAPAIANPQHIALATEDVIAGAERMRAEVWPCSRFRTTTTTTSTPASRYRRSASRPS
jgi:hypothetical protein